MWFAAAAANYTFENIRLLELEAMRPHGSPTKSLMMELGSRNTTVRQLYDRLNEIRRYREMQILEDYGELCVSKSLKILFFILVLGVLL